MKNADCGTSFIFGYEQNVEYLIRTSFQREASLKLWVHELFLEENHGTVMLNWEQRGRKASVRTIQQHKLITQLKSHKNRDTGQVYVHILNNCTFRKQEIVNRGGGVCFQPPTVSGILSDLVY